MAKSKWPTAAATSLVCALVLSVALASVAPSQAAESGHMEPDPERGAEGYAEDCAECHASVPRLMRRVPGTDAEQHEEWLAEFLVDHYAPDPQLRRDIIAYMLTY
jgi:mono/diheme cytochrome c family protein